MRRSELVIGCIQKRGKSNSPDRAELQMTPTFSVHKCMATTVTSDFQQMSQLSLCNLHTGTEESEL